MRGYTSCRQRNTNHEESGSWKRVKGDSSAAKSPKVALAVDILAFE